MRPLFSLFLILAFGFTIQLHGQYLENPTPYLSLNDQLDLPTDQVYDFHFKGESIFFATDDGVYRFRQNQLQKYSEEDGIEGSVFFKLFEDSQGRIWALSYRQGISIFNGETWIPGFFNDTLADVLRKAYIYQVGELSPNEFILTTHKSFQKAIYVNLETQAVEFIDIPRQDLVSNHTGYYLLHPETREVIGRGVQDSLSFTFLRSRVKPSPMAFNDTVVHYHGNPIPTLLFEGELEDDDWNSTHMRMTARRLNDTLVLLNQLSRLYLWNDYRGTIKTVDILDAEDALSMTLIGDEVYVGTNGDGLLIYRLNSGELERMDHLFKESVVPQAGVDKEGNIWVSVLNQGLYIVADRSLKRYNLPIRFTNTRTARPAQLVDNYVMVLKDDSIHYFHVEEHNSTLKHHVGHPLTPEGHSFRFQHAEWEDQTVFFKAYRLESEAPNLRYAELMDSSLTRDDMFGTRRVIANIEANRIIVLKNSALFYLNGSGPMIEVANPRLNRHGFNDALFHNDTLLIGTQFGLYYLKDDSLYTYLPEVDILKDNISQIEELGDGSLVIAIRDKGLYWLHSSSSSFLTESDMLPSNLIKDLQAKDNWVYGATDVGLFALQFESDTIAHVSHIPYQSLGINGSMDNIILNTDHVTASSEEIVMKLSYDLFQKPRPIPIIRLIAMSIMGELRTAPFSRRIDLERGENTLGLSFGSNQLSQNFLPTLWAIRYDNGTWRYQSSGEFDFRSQSVGKHTVEVKARSPYGQWSDSLEYEFVVRKPILETSWFWILLASPFVFMSIYSVIEFIRRRKLQQSLLESNFTSLKMQINPHFIFNSFNSIQYLIAANKNDKAQLYLSQFAHLIRKIISRPDLHRISLKEELTYIEEYMELEKLRLDSQVDFLINVAPNIKPEQTFIPPMLLQPILENSVWHGISTNADEKSKIEVRIEQPENDCLKIHIIDNGTGFPRKKWEEIKLGSTPSRSLGLRNVLSRLQILSQIDERKFDLELMETNRGTHFVLTLAS